MLDNGRSYSPQCCESAWLGCLLIRIYRRITQQHNDFFVQLEAGNVVDNTCSLSVLDELEPLGDRQRHGTLAADRVNLFVGEGARALALGHWPRRFQFVPSSNFRLNPILTALHKTLDRRCSSLCCSLVRLRHKHSQPQQ